MSAPRWNARTWPGSSTCSTSPRAARTRRPNASSSAADRALRHRRGALRLAVGARLPARLPRALRARRALARRSAHRAHRHGHRGDAPRDHRTAPPRGRQHFVSASTGRTSSTASSRNRRCASSFSTSSAVRGATPPATPVAGIVYIDSDLRLGIRRQGLDALEKGFSSRLYLNPVSNPGLRVLFVRRRVRGMESSFRIP